MNISIIVPSMGRGELLRRFLDSLRRTASRSYDVCIGFDPSGDCLALFQYGQFGLSHAGGEEFALTDGLSTIRWADPRRPGMHEAIEAAIAISSGDWLIMVHDDMVFLPGWDDFSFGLDRDLILCFELLDGYGLTWPPAVSLEGATAEAEKRQQQRTMRAVWQSIKTHGWLIAPPTEPIQVGPGIRIRYGGPFFGTSLCHRSRWVPWPSWSGTKYRTHDTAWVMETHLQHPDVAFGWMPGNCLYHTIGGSVHHKTDIEPDDPLQFERTYGMTAPEAAEKVYAHSRSLRGDIP